ncbi:MAG: LysR family transcriptional regulator [Cryobacterium sp.]|nr:LysR family transcriptional regulator [Oligoflexia bacterium]
MFEIRYFLAVARFENIHRASEKLNASPASLSKAISRLESELETKLFSREGRNIRLTVQGRALQKRAAEIVRLEEDTRLEIGGGTSVLRVVMAGAEVLLSKTGMAVSQIIKKKYPGAQFEFHAVGDEEAVGQVKRGEAHLALTTAEVSHYGGIVSKVMSETEFQTVVGAGHPLYPAAKARKIVPVETVLKYGFVSPCHPLLGKVGPHQSLDGWRDDRFPRKIEYLTSSLRLMEEFVTTGKAIAYLPDTLCENTSLIALKVSGCPYTCLQKVKLVAKNPHELTWLSQLF